MNIGIFTPQHSVERMRSLLVDYPHVDFHYFVYDELGEVKKAFERNIHFLDGVLFSGLLAYMLVEEKFGEFNKPVAYLKLSDADFYKQLFHLILDNPSIDFSKVFIDFHAESEGVNEFIQKLPEKQRPHIVDDSDIYVSNDVYERLLKIHENFHSSRDVEWSFTRFANIVEILDQKNIRYNYFDISDETIHKTLHDLMNEINLHDLKDNQIVCGHLMLGNVPKDLREIRLLNIHSLLLDYNQQQNAQLQIREISDGFALTTTYISLETLTNGFQSCSLLKHLSEYIKEPIHIGWGIGRTFVQAQANAKQACDYSYQNHVSSTYVLENDETVIGPLLSASEFDHHDLRYDPDLLTTIQTHVDMTNDQIHKVLLAFKLIKREQIASAEFAEVIGVTVRSANRILKRAEEERLVRSAVDTTSGLQGRPRKLYQLNKDLLTE